MKFIARSGTQRSRDAWIALNGRLKRIHHRVIASSAGKHQILIERRFESAGIGSPQYGVGWLDVVGDSDARLRLGGLGDAVVDIAANSQIEESSSSA